MNTLHDEEDIQRQEEFAMYLMDFNARQRYKFGRDDWFEKSIEETFGDI